MEFIKFIIKCILLALDGMVGNVNKTPEEQAIASHGAIGCLVFSICFLILIKKYYLDHDGYPNGIGWILLLISIGAMVFYFAVVYRFIL